MTIQFWWQYAIVFAVGGIGSVMSAAALLYGASRPVGSVLADAFWFVVQLASFAVCLVFMLMAGRALVGLAESLLTR